MKDARATTGFAALTTLLQMQVPFDTWSPATLRRLVQESSGVAFPKGTVVQHAGAGATAVYLLTRGVLETMTEMHNGAWHGVARWRPFSLLGLQSTFLPEPALRKQTWVAQTDVQLRSIPFRTVRECFAADRVMARDVMGLLAGHTHVLLGELAYATLLSAHGKVARRLLYISEPPFVLGSTTRSVVQVTQAQLAEMLGLTRQRVNSVLREFKARQLVRVRRHEIEILSPQGLREVVSARAPGHRAR